MLKFYIPWLLIFLFSFTAKVTAQNLLANIPFDNGTTSIKGVDIVGTKVGAISTTDRFGKPNSAYEFDGVDDYIDFGSDEIFDLRDGFSLSAWFNTTSTKTFQTILGRGYFGDGDYWLAVYNNGTNNVIRFWLEGNFVNGTIPVPDGWNHVALVAETGTNNVIIYLNNEVYLNYTVGTDLIGSSAFNLRIGNDDRDESYYFKGKIDDILIYSKPLTRAEIGVLSNAIPMDFTDSEPEFGNALDFDGVNDFSLISAANLGDSEEGFTFETWVKWEASNPANRSIFYAGADFSDYFKLDGNGLIAFNGTNSPNGTGRFSMTLPITYPNDNQWHHVAFTIDKINNYAAIYLDGELQSEAPNNEPGSNPANYPPATTVFTPFDLGSQLYKATIGRDEYQINYFEGKLDETRIWNSSRDAIDIDRYLTLPVNDDQDGLIYYFKYDQGIPSGDNRSINKIKNSAGNTDGDLLGFSLFNSANSNFFVSSISNLPYAPVITGIYPKIGMANDIVTIYGTNFIPLDGYNKVFIGGKVANLVPPVSSSFAPAPSTNPNSIKVYIPDGISGNAAVYIANGGGTSYVGSIQVQSKDASLPFDFITNQIYSQIVSPRSIAHADIDEDGETDLVVSGKNRLVILYRKDDGYKAVDVSTNTAIFDLINVFDVENDGDQDIIVYESGNIVLYRNTNGSWASSIIMINPELGYIGSGFTQQGGIVNMDFDGDGYIDLITRKRLGFGWLRNLGNGSFENYKVLNEDNQYLGLAVGDVNNDRIIDIVTSFSTWGSFEPSPSKLHIFKNDGNGNLTKELIGEVSDYGDNLLVADINNDNLMDIISANYNGPVRYWLNNGSGIYVQYQLPIWNSTFNIEVADLDADGHNDFIITQRENIIWARNNGEASQPTFEVITIQSDLFNAIEAKVLDADRDGDLDVISISRDDNKVNLYNHLFSDNNFVEYTINRQIEDVNNSINLTKHTVNLIVPYGYDRSNIIGQFEISKKSRIYIGDAQQISGVTANSFVSPKVYTIISESGRSQNWTVSLNPLPAIPLLTEVDDITQVNAEIDWEESEYASSYFVQISTDDFDSFDEFETTELTLLADLTPGTNYQIRIGAKNVFGNSQGFSQVEEFTTIPANPAISSIEEITSTSAVINWIENEGTEQYLLDVSKDTTFNEFVGGYNNRGVASLAESIIGLQPGKTYYTRIRANNESGTSSNSDTVIFKTIPAKPTLTLDNITQRGLKISWTTIEGVDGYTLQVFNGSDTIVNQLNANDNKIIIDTLRAASLYKFRLSAFNESGSSGYSEVVTALTIPKTPNSLSVEAIKNTSAKLVWGEVEGTNGYLLEVSSDNFSTKLSAYNPKSISATSDNLEGLSGGITYSFRIKSVNESGQSPYSETVSFSTIPNRPVARGASAVTASSFIANWDAVNGLNIGYYLELSKSANFQVVERQTFVNDGLSKEFTGLENGVSYWYRLAAIKATDTSQRSNSIFVEQPLQIIDFQFNEEKSREDLTRSKTSFMVKGGTNQFNVSIRYKGILSNVWSERINLQAVVQEYQYEFANNLFDEIGLQFEINITDGLNTLNQLENFIYLTDTEEEVVTLDLTNAWQLFSIPYNFQDNLIETIFDEMGPFEYKSEWRLMQYDGQKYVDAGGGINRIELGESYWFYTTQEVSIKIEGATINTTSPFAMVLEEGWNQIGNPYNIPISWSSVVSSNNELANLENLYLFNSNTQKFEEDDRLEAFSGGFVWANSQTEVAISLLDNNFNQRESDEYKLTSQNIDAENWKVNLLLNQAEIASVGMAEEGLLSKDLFDRVALPRFINYTEMYSLHEEYFYPYFKEDIRPLNEQESWLFHFETNQSKGLNTLQWDNSSFQYATKQLWLINENNGDLINMNTANEYSFYYTASQQFSVHLSSSLNDKPTPFNVLVGNIFPNPTNGQIGIQLGLPKSSNSYKVLLSLYSANGELISVLYEEEIASGIYQLSANLDVSFLNSGLYYLTINISGEHLFNRVDKLVLK